MGFKKLLFLFLCFTCTFKGFSTHIVGGEIYYRYLGNNQYQITLKVYRDCINGKIGFDDPASLGIYSSDGKLVRALALDSPVVVVLPVELNNPCFKPPTDVCVEEAIYRDTVHLPHIPGGYTLTYQRCCRNKTILNLMDPEVEGATYTTQILDTTIAKNSSPSYNNFPPIFLCAGVPLHFDHSATDLDGDSLVYELCDPYHGASQMVPMPQPPDPPPYPYVTWSSGYSGTYPMSASPPVIVNSRTGLLTGTPDKIGQWVVAVCVKEYRKGILLSTNKRDFQFNVVNCPQVISASIPSQKTFCEGKTVQFYNSSLNGTSYFWDFGDPAVTNDTSVQVTPNYTYSDTGVFKVMLIINKGTVCADTAYSTFRVYPSIAAHFTRPPGQCIDKNNFYFDAQGVFTDKASIKWDFGTNANIPSSALKQPTGIKYSTYGKFPVTLTISDYGCTSTFTDTVEVYPLPVANFNSTPMMGCVPFSAQFSDSSIAGTTLSYLWDFGDGSTSTEANPGHKYFKPGIYDVSLTIITSNGCIDTFTFQKPKMITVKSIPEAKFTVDPFSASIFTPDIKVIDKSLYGTSCYLFFGDGDSLASCNALHTYTKPGIYTITQVTLNEYGCKDTFRLNVEIRPEFRFFIPNAFTPNGDGTNDMFFPVTIGVTDFSFLIFNRWGEILFKSSDTSLGWDGMYMGRGCQEDVYVYRVSFKDIIHHKNHTYIGRVTLIR